MLMRFAVEYTTKSGMVGLIIFSADNLNNAQIYMEELVTYHGHDHVYNLNELTEGTVGELFRLYPGIANVTVRSNVSVKGHG
jgi:hypothetical protein